MRLLRGKGPRQGMGELITGLKSSIALSKADLTSLAFLALLPLLLLWSFVFRGQVLYFRDITLVFQPATEFLRQSLERGQLPLWNPLVAGGYPQLASLEPPLFYPGMLLFYGLPYGLALTTFVFLNHVAAGWGWFALGRFWGWSRPASLAAALIYSYSGYLVTSSNLYPSQAMAALLPVALLALERALRNPRAGCVALATAVWAIQLSGTRPDLTLMEAVLLLCLASARAWQVRHRGWQALFPTAGIVALVFSGGLLLNGASFLPAVEFIQHSNRQEGILAAEAQVFSYAPLNIVSLFAPSLFGDVEWHTDWGRYFIGEPGMHYTNFFLALYAGWLPWMLLPIAWRSRRPDVAWLTSLGGVAFVLALGRHTPAYGLFLQALPLAHFMRYPVKFFLLVTWCLAALAGHGMEELLRRPRPYRPYLLGLGAVFGLTFAVWELATLRSGSWLQLLEPRDYRPWLTGPVDFDINVFMRQMWPLIFPEMALSCGVALATALLSVLAALMASAREPRVAGYRDLPLLLLLVADLVPQNGRFNFGAPGDYFRREPPVIREMKARTPGGHLYRFYKPLGHGERLGSPQDVRRLGLSASTVVPYQLNYFTATRDRLSANIAMAYGIAGIYSGVSLTPYLSSAYLMENVQLLPSGSAPDLATMAGLLNIRYLLVPFVPRSGEALSLPEKLRDPALQVAWQDRRAGLWLLENTKARPRAFFVAEALPVPDVAKGMQELGSGRIDLDRMVTLEQGSPPAANANRPRGGLRSRALPPAVTIRAYGNNYVQATLTAAQDGYLILTDNYYPGWEARLDGKAVAIERADVVLRAVAVPAGKHVLEFRYTPWTVLGGLLVSLAGWGIVLFWLSADRNSRNRFISDAFST